MKKLSFSSVEFLRATATEENFPEFPYPEVAIVGRSNVGKSSLINHLLNQKIAKVSATPGKTQTINFFLIDKSLILVDLPGYGYARVTKNLKESWGKAIESYFAASRDMRLVLLLLDMRHLPTDEDVQFLNWALHHQKKILLIFTKSDKLTRQEQRTANEKIVNFLKQKLGKAPAHVIQNLDLGTSQSPGVERSDLAHISNMSDNLIVPTTGAFASSRNQILNHVGYISYSIKDGSSRQLLITKLNGLN